MSTSKKKNRKKNIRDIATKLFATKGYENTTTRDISNAANISKAALYYHFDSKEDLLYQILEEAMIYGLEQIEEIEKSGLDLKDKLSAYLKMHSNLIADLDRMKILVRDQESLTPTYRKALVEKQRKYVKKFVDLLNELRDSGGIIDLDTTICAYAFFGMVGWTYHWYNPGGRVNLNQLAKILEQIFTKGIFTDRPS